MKDNFHMTVENTINSTGSISVLLEKVKAIIEPSELWPFMAACLLHWTTGRYDDRNRRAVFLSRKIIRQFPSLKATEIPTKVMTEAGYFTVEAHRYLQQMMFDIIMKHLELTGYMGIAQWCQQQMFVYNRNFTDMIPRQQYQ